MKKVNKTLNDKKQIARATAASATAAADIGHQ